MFVNINWVVIQLHWVLYMMNNWVEKLKDWFLINDGQNGIQDNVNRQTDSFGEKISRFSLKFYQTFPTCTNFQREQYKIFSECFVSFTKLLREKCWTLYGVISGPYFPVFGPEITPYLDNFHSVNYSQKLTFYLECYTYYFKDDWCHS